MPSPFPGMDPWLENPARWPDVHQGLIASMRAILNTLLPPGYVANMGERCQILPATRDIYPDVFVRSREGTPLSGQRESSTALLAPSPPLIVEELALEPSEVFLEIRNVADGYRLITVIEVLSYSNKAVGSVGRERYLQKQREVLASHTHLIELDFLRTGLYSVAAPVADPSLALTWDYLACLHRGGEGRRFAVWLNSLHEPLPCIAVPLEEDIPDVGLDLQAVFNRNYEEGAYQFQIDYTQDPIPPLTGDDAVWADALLREKGLR